MDTETPWTAAKESKGVKTGLIWIAFSTVLIAALIVATARGLSDSDKTIWNDTNWLQLGGGWFLMCSALWALGHRWRALLPVKTRPSGSELGAALCGALLLNYAVPGPFGELAAAHHIHRRHKIPFATTLASGGVARLTGLFTAAISAQALSAISGVAIEADHRWALWICLAGIASGAVLLGALFATPLHWVRMAQSSESGLKGKVMRLLAELAKAIVDCSSKRALTLALFWSMIGHLLAGAGLAVSIDALYGNAQWGGLAVTYLVGTCLGAVAFLFPGTQFAWDALIAGLLKSTAGLNGFQAIGGALTLRVEQLWMMGLGALSLQWLSRLKGKEQKIET